MNREKIDQLSVHLFWDVDRDKVNWDEHRHFLVGRILEYGLMDDWKILHTTLGLNEITRVAKELRSLDDISLNFIATISGSKKEEFRCYTWKQSHPKHWNF